MTISRHVRRNDRGAVLLQVLLGLGIMVAMTPLILSQARKYSEQIKREEVVAEMQLIRKAVSSYISFDKNKVPDNCVLKEGDDMKGVLENYGGKDLAKGNGFGETYYFVTCKNPLADGIVEAVVGAYGGGLDEVTLNGIGQYLFDQGAVLSNDGEWLSNYSISLSGSLKNYLLSDSKYKGSLVMYVSDAFMLTDYLHVNKMTNGTTDNQMVNTMLASLNMNEKSMQNVKDADGTKLIVSKELKVSSLAGQTATFSPSSFSVSGVVEVQSSTANTFSAGKLPILPEAIDISKLELAEEAKVRYINMEKGDLSTETLEVGVLSVAGDVELVGRPGDPATFDAAKVSADTLNSSGPGVNAFANITMNDNVVEGAHSYIYGGELNMNGAYIDSSSSVINLSGVSEVVDVCWDTGGCLSTKVQATYDALLEAIKAYYAKAGQLLCVQEGGQVAPVGHTYEGQCIGDDGNPFNPGGV
jgi:hypothetical protein